MPVITSIKIPIVVLAFLSLLLGSCHSPSRFFFVKNSGAVMPVKIRGNSNSHTYILLLPGGPSGDGLVYSTVFSMFKKQIEPHYKMVYYDQRGAGNCQGIYETSTLNLDQLAEDLDRIIQTIKNIDAQSRIYLLGYSYGGTLGLTYLLKEEQSAEVEGFISIAGAFDRKSQQANQQKLVQYLLDRWVEEGYLDNYEAMQDGFHCSNTSNPVQCKQDSAETVRKVNARLEELKDYNRFRLKDGMLSRLLSYAFFSQSNPIYSGTNESQNGKYYQPEFDRQKLSNQVAALKLPVLLINGRMDTNVPFFDAVAVYENIGTPESEKSLLILEESGHIPMLTEPKELAEGIIGFIRENEKR